MQSMDLEPFDLCVTVISASNVPIADTFSSDPYVSVNLDNKTFGQTKIIKQNHTNPHWNEFFRKKMLHRNHLLEFRIYDDDPGKDPDYLGRVAINLNDYPVSKEFQSRVYEVELAQGYKGSNGKTCSLEVSVILGRRESLLQMVHFTIEQVNNAANDHKVRQLEAEEGWQVARDMIKQSFLDFAQEGLLMQFDAAILKDLLYDVVSLFSPLPAIIDGGDYSRTAFRREQLKLINATKIDLITAEDHHNNGGGAKKGETAMGMTLHRHPPIEEHSLQVILSDGHVIIFACGHRFALWRWTCWTVTAFRVWSGQMSKEELPVWVSNGSFGMTVTMARSNGKSLTGRAVYSLDRPFEVIVAGERVSLQGMVSLILSADSDLPSNYKLMLSQPVLHHSAADAAKALTAANNASQQQKNEEAAAAAATDAQTTAKKEKDMHRTKSWDMNPINAIGSTLKGATKGIKAAVKVTANTAAGAVTGVANTAAGAVTGVASGVAYTAVGAARNVASGNPAQMISAAKDTVMEVSKGVASTVTGAPNLLFGSSSRWVTIRGNHDSFKLDLDHDDGDDSSDRGVRTCIEFDLEDLSGACHSMHKHNQAPGSSSVVGSFPPKQATDLRLELTVFARLDRCRLLGQHNEKMDQLLTFDEYGQLIPTAAHQKFNLDSSLGYMVTIHDISDLLIPTDSTLRPTGLFAKCKFAFGSGHSGRQEAGEDHKSPVVAVSSHPNMKDHSFILRASERYDQHCFIRIEIYLDYPTSATSIGAVFIPLDFFDIHERKYTFAVSRFRGKMIAMNGYGTATVSIKKIDEEIVDEYNLSPKDKLSLTALTVVKESGLLYDTFFGECMPAGSFDNEGFSMSSVERVSIAATIQGLKLVEIEGAVVVNNDWSMGGYSLQNPAELGRLFLGGGGGGGGGGGNSSGGHGTASVDSLAPTEIATQHHPVATSISEDYNEREDFIEEITIEIFENQRRQPFPPFDWSSSAITRARYTDRDFKVSYQFDSMVAASAPEGFVWKGSWEIDKLPCGPNSSDSSGWMYGFYFGKVLDNYKRGLTYTSPWNAHARRRRWIRKAVVNADAKEGRSRHFTSRDTLLDFDRVNASTVGLDRGSLLGSDFTSHDTAAAAAATVAGGNSSTHVGSSSHGPITNNNEQQQKWRRNKDDSRILSCCQEKSDEDSDILIDWEQVLFLEAITPSILLISFRVHRYFDNSGSQANKKGGGASLFMFKPADMVMFVSNCPAIELKALVEERMLLRKMRTDLTRLIASGNVSGHAAMSALSSPTSPVLTKEEMDEAEGVPETAELSLGSEIASDLDEQITHIMAIVQRLKKNPSLSAKAETEILLRRLCRLRLYLAALYGLGLSSAHELSEDGVRQVMEADFRRCQSIELDNPVRTAKNRLEYLIDMAEKRIRDVALCGWQQQEELQVCAQLLTNGYLGEIVHVLGAFFEDRALNEIKGLGNKVELIKTYLEHNDRLDLIIASAFRPYKLRAEPKACLSLCLDFSILATWYTHVLDEEMQSRVDSVLAVWQDDANDNNKKTRSDPSGRLAEYTFPLPWIPCRARSNSGAFFTNIPEDVRDTLQTYLSFARIDERRVAISFKPSISQMDAKICLAYANAYLHLGEAYGRALIAKDWLLFKEIVQPVSTTTATGGSAAAKEEESELSEYTTWLSSVANDLHRVLTNQLYTADKDMMTAIVEPAVQRDRDLLLALTERTITSAKNSAMEQLAGIIMAYVFMNSGKEQMLIGGSNALRTAFIKSTTTKEEGHDCCLLSSILEDVASCHEAFSSYLNPVVSRELLCLLLQQMIVLYLWLLQDLAAAGEIYTTSNDNKDTTATTHPLLLALVKEGTTLTEGMTKLISSLGMNDTADQIGLILSISMLDHLMPVFSQPLGSLALDSAILSLGELTKHGVRLTAALITAIECILSLRGVYKHFTPAQQASYALSHRSIAAVPSAVSHSQVAITAGPATTVAGAAGQTPVKRRSMLSSFHLFGHHHHDDQSPVTTVTDATTARAPPPPTAEQQMVMDDEDALESNKLLQQNLAMKQQIALECVENSLLQIKDLAASEHHQHGTHAGHGHHHHHHSSHRHDDEPSSFGQLEPLVRVFGNNEHRSSLRGQLFAWSAEDRTRSRSLLTEDQHAAGRFSSLAAGMMFRLPFSMANAAAPSLKHISNSLSGKGFASSFSTEDGDGEISSPGSNRRSSRSCSSVKSPATAQLVLQISQLSVTRLFYIDIFRSPHPYLVFSVHDPNGKTVAEARSTTITLASSATQDAVWDEDELLSLPVEELSVSKLELRLELFYEGMVSPQSIAKLKVISFSPYDPPSFTSRQFILTEFDAASKVAAAKLKAEQESRLMPSVSFTIAPVRRGGGGGGVVGVAAVLQTATAN